VILLPKFSKMLLSLSKNHSIMGIKELGAALQKRRKDLGITQPHLAEIAGISKNTLYKLERGESNPSWEIVLKLIDVLGLSLQLEIKKMM
jgi:DNA-binding XRE family transcriptional regulator